MYVCMYDMTYEWLLWYICEHLSCYAWKECDTWTYMIQWKCTMCDIWIYMNASVDYIIWWKICGHYDTEKVMNDICSMILMSYSTVHEHAPDDIFSKGTCIEMDRYLMYEFHCITWDIRAC